MPLYGKGGGGGYSTNLHFTLGPILYRNVHIAPEQGVEHHVKTSWNVPSGGTGPGGRNGLATHWFPIPFCVPFPVT